ncbi:MAG: putative rRNA maturation factor [Porticoccus sp.]|jgi:probable rRNA maturation factor
MNLTLYMKNASSSPNVPDEKLVHQWICVALAEINMGRKDDLELSVCVVNEEESADLNQRYRHKQGPTNVLSFPADLPDSLQLPLLGDLVICAKIVEREAHQQDKSLDAHWAHMLIHGSLHLMGYDHIDDRDAEDMELLETKIITSLNFPPPYEQSPGATNTQ